MRTSYGLGGALRAIASFGLWGPAAPLGPVVAPLVPRCALLPAPTPRDVLSALGIPFGPIAAAPGMLGGGRSPIKRGWGREGVRSELASGATTGPRGAQPP